MPQAASLPAQASICHMYCVASPDGIPDGELVPAAVEHPVALPHLHIGSPGGPVPRPDLDGDAAIHGGCIHVSRGFVHHHLQPCPPFGHKAPLQALGG